MRNNTKFRENSVVVVSYCEKCCPLSPHLHTVTLHSYVKSYCCSVVFIFLIFLFSKHENTSFSNVSGISRVKKVIQSPINELRNIKISAIKNSKKKEKKSQRNICC